MRSLPLERTLHIPIDNGTRELEDLYIPRRAHQLHKHYYYYRMHGKHNFNFLYNFGLSV